jgi:alpha-N-arabinofuranosidase
MSLAWLLVLSGSWGALAQNPPATKVDYTLHPNRILNQIDEKVYGHFFEHIYHSANGGLWGELVWNRSFEENSAGQWSIRDNTLVQSGMGDNIRRDFGDPRWTDYEFTLEAQKTGGSEGFLILFRVAGPEDYYWYNLGGWGNVRSQLEKAVKGAGRGGVGPSVDGKIDNDKWYSIRVRCEGQRYQVWLDGKQMLDYTDASSPHSAGRVGVGTWNTTARFRNIKVVSLDGKTLFEGLPPVESTALVARHWAFYGPGQCDLADANAFNSSFAQVIESPAGESGLQQSAFCINKGETYAGSLWTRGSAPEGLAVRLVSGGKTVAEQKIATPGAAWSEGKFEFHPQVSDANATLQIAVLGKAKVWIDQVSLMPQSWQAAGGFRPDLLEAVAALKPPIIRWPGGCFASPYHWKDGIGPQEKRRVTRRPMWDDLDVDSLGTDEFIALCRKVGAEPLLVVNIGTPQWNADATTNDFLQDALDWIEYCNGPADSKWGKVRAANGHPQPYNVKYWEIDNETWGFGIDNYIASVKKFAPALKKADPSIKLAACGSAGINPDPNDTNGLKWNRLLIESCATLIDYVSIHHYEDPGQFAQGPRNFERFLHLTANLIAQSANPKLKIDCSEWNAQSIDWRTGLYAGGLLNTFEKCGDTFEIGGPALFLRHVSATDWNNAFINFDQKSWFPAPNYVVMQLWRNHYAPNRIEIAPEPNALNTVATKSADGKTLYVKCVNPGKSAIEVSLSVTEGPAPTKATMEIVSPGSLEAKNSLSNPKAVQVESANVRLDSGKVSFTLPALSAGVVTIQM